MCYLSLSCLFFNGKFEQKKLERARGQMRGDAAGANGGEGENLGPLSDGGVPRQDDLRAEYADMRA